MQIVWTRSADIEIYFSNRRQQVILNGQCSKWYKMSFGVPQASVLGPLLFIIYINDITRNITCHIKLSADDTLLFTTARNENVDALNSNWDMGKIMLWVWQWKTKFNVAKIEEILLL